MITAITRFPVPPGTDEAALKKMFEASAPRYQAVPGLLRKHYFVGGDGRCGGVYLFESRAAADALFNEEFASSIKERFGAPPQVEYLSTLLIVDNEKGAVIDPADAAAGA